MTRIQALKSMKSEINIYRIINIILYFSLFCALTALLLCLYCNQPKFKYHKFSSEKWVVEDYQIQDGDTYESLAKQYCDEDTAIEEYIYNIEQINNNKVLKTGDYMAIYTLRENSYSGFLLTTPR